MQINLLAFPSHTPTHTKTKHAYNESLENRQHGRYRHQLHKNHNLATKDATHREPLFLGAHQPQRVGLRTRLHGLREDGVERGARAVLLLELNGLDPQRLRRGKGREQLRDDGARALDAAAHQKLGAGCGEGRGGVAGRGKEWGENEGG